MLMNGYAWSAPRGFLTFALADVTAAWVEATADRIAPGSTDFRDELARAVAWCVQQEARPDAFHVLVSEREGDRPRVLGAGTVEFGPPLDLAELAAGWQRQLAERGRDGDVSFTDSRRAPIAVLREVVLEQLADGQERYVERGKVMKLFRRAGLTGVITVESSNLVAFDDLVRFLTEAAADFQVEEPVDA